MNKKYKINYGFAIVEQYKLPPLMAITNCSIKWVLSQATSRKHKRYLAAQIILGQPFNLPAN